MAKTQSIFIFVAAVMLFCLAALDVLCGFGSAPVLKQPDTLLQLNEHWALSGREVLFLKALSELTVSALLLAGKSLGMKLGWLAWLTTNLAIYRAALWQADVANLGDYLGNCLEWFLIQPRTMAIASEVLIAFLLVGSYGLMIANCVKGRRPSKIESSSVVVQPSP